MIAKNKYTGEVIRDLDPSDDNDLYYSLDKRKWEFKDEFPKTPVAYVQVIEAPGLLYSQKGIIPLRELEDWRLGKDGKLSLKPEALDQHIAGAI